MIFRPETAEAGWIVRVLAVGVARESGPLRQGRVTIGRALVNDVVLRDLEAAGPQVALDLAGGAPARLQMLKGEASLLGHVLAAPATAVLPPYTPLCLGGVQVAYGEPDSSRWRDAEHLAQAVRSGPTLVSALSEAAPPAPSAARLATRALQRAAPHLPVALAALAACLALVGVGESMWGVAHASAPSIRRPARPTAARADIVSRAEDLFMSVGVAARTTVDNHGGAIVSVPRGSDPLVIDEARRRLLHEAPSLKHVQIVFGPAETTAPPAPGAARVIAAVSGPGGYLVAADGSRYFPGAVLPTGQVLKEIDQNAMIFDQDGLITRLNLEDGDLG